MKLAEAMIQVAIMLAGCLFLIAFIHGITG